MNPTYYLDHPKEEGCTNQKKGWMYSYILSVQQCQWFYKKVETILEHTGHAPSMFRLLLQLGVCICFSALQHKILHLFFVSSLVVLLLPSPESAHNTVLPSPAETKTKLRLCKLHIRVIYFYTYNMKGQLRKMVKGPGDSAYSSTFSFLTKADDQTIAYKVVLHHWFALFKTVSHPKFFPLSTQIQMWGTGPAGTPPFQRSPYSSKAHPPPPQICGTDMP